MFHISIARLPKGNKSVTVVLSHSIQLSSLNIPCKVKVVHTVYSLRKSFNVAKFCCQVTPVCLHSDVFTIKFNENVEYAIIFHSVRHQLINADSPGGVLPQMNLKSVSKSLEHQNINYIVHMSRDLVKATIMTMWKCTLKLGHRLLCKSLVRQRSLYKKSI